MSMGWFILFLVLLVVEFATVNLVTIWFALGALGAVFVSLVTESLAVQSIVFVVVSILALLLTKPLIKKFNIIHKEPTNCDRLIGMEAVVVEDIKDNEYGKVKILGDVWLAASKTSIKEGTKVVVKDIQGVKLIVEKKEEK